MQRKLTRRALLRLIGMAGLASLLTGTLAMRMPERDSTTGTADHATDDTGVTVDGWLLNIQDR